MKAIALMLVCIWFCVGSASAQSEIKAPSVDHLVLDLFPANTGSPNPLATIEYGGRIVETPHWSLRMAGFTDMRFAISSPCDPMVHTQTLFHKDFWVGGMI